MDEFQFYPTPRHLAKRVWDLFTTKVTLILEPHAGNGDLVIPYLQDFPEAWDERTKARRASWEETQRMRGNANPSFVNREPWHACEINLNMHPRLKELGAVIVGFDFLEMKSAASYSHLVLNPPFRNGDKHLLHAWNILFAGEIGCILNAETIRNPRSTEARKLVELIDKHGSVEYLQDQFLGEDVERETAVEIAIVYLHKESQTALNIDAILESLKPDTYSASDEEVPSLNSVALPMNFIERVTLDYTMAVNASKVSAEASAISLAADLRLGHTFEELQAKGQSSETRPQQIDLSLTIRNALASSMAALREKAWAQVLKSTELHSKLSSAGRKAVDSQFAAISLLEFNQANILGFISGLEQSQGDIAEEMCLSLFDQIMERDSDNCVFFKSWKSNQKHKAIGMRIKKSRFILPLSRHDYSRQRSIGWNTEATLNDMDRVFAFLAGPTNEDEAAQRQHMGLKTALSREFSRLLAGEKVETMYFNVRYFSGIGTWHFYPNNEGIIEKLNQYVGRVRQWLPPNMDMANTDFKKQYEKAESLQSGYEEALRNKRSGSRTHSSLSFTVNQLDKGKREDGVHEYSAFLDAVNEVLTIKGIFPNDELTALEVSEKADTQPRLSLLPPSQGLAMVQSDNLCLPPMTTTEAVTQTQADTAPVRSIDADLLSQLALV